MPPLIGQLDYREWLRKLYEERKARDSFFSYRFLAEKVGMDHSLLIKVLQGRRHLADDALAPWISYLKLDRREEEYFRSLVRFCKTRSAVERTQALDRLLALQATRARRLEKDHWEYFRDWRHVALRGVVGLDGRLEPAQAGARLDPPMGAREAREAIALLERLGLVSREADGRLTLSDSYIEAGPGIAPTAIREHQKEMLRLAAESIERHPPAVRQVSSATVTLSLSDLEEVRGRIRALRDSILRLSAASGEADHVYQFQTVLFPLTRVHASVAATASRK